VIHRLKDLIDHVVTSIEIEDRYSAMRAIVRFTDLFKEFIQQNKEYIFDREILDLNQSLMQIMHCIEHDDLQGIKEIINARIKLFLDGWDFDNDYFIN
jgi:collagenase-like PrtC family protease